MSRMSSKYRAFVKVLAPGPATAGDLPTLSTADVPAAGSSRESRMSPEANCKAASTETRNRCVLRRCIDLNSAYLKTEHKIKRSKGRL